MWPFTKKVEPKQLNAKPDLKQQLAERISWLPMRLTLMAAVLAGENELDADRILTTKIFCGYLFGIGDCIEEQNQMLAAVIRATTFNSIYGEERGKILFRKIHELINDNDQQAKRGWGAGVADGERLLLDPDMTFPEDAASLASMFQLKLVEIDKQVE